MMGPLAAIAIGSVVLGSTLLDSPDPVPLTDVQREMIESGMFEPDSFREPAFEALVENLRSWEPETYQQQAVSVRSTYPETIAGIFQRERGEVASIFSGTVRTAEPLGDAFPGVTRLAVDLCNRKVTDDRVCVCLVFLVDEDPPEIGSRHFFMGRIYKIMHLQTQQSDLPTPFPAIVARTFDYVDPSDEIEPFPMNAIITALTGALAVVFFIVVMGRHMLGKPAPRRSPLASTTDRPDDPSDA